MGIVDWLFGKDEEETPAANVTTQAPASAVPQVAAGNAPIPAANTTVAKTANMGAPITGGRRRKSRKNRKSRKSRRRRN